MHRGSSSIEKFDKCGNLTPTVALPLIYAKLYDAPTWKLETRGI